VKILTANKLQWFFMALAGVGLCLMLVFMFVGENQFFDYRALQRQNSAITVENEALRQKNLETSRLVDRLKNDMSYIEHVAREELGMVKKDEVVYTFGRQGKGK